MSFANVGPYTTAVAVVTNDVTILPKTRALYIGVTGDVAVDLYGGSSNVLFKAAPVGLLLVEATRVYATGTTATNILALR
jgi:hypothetical protein